MYGIRINQVKLFLSVTTVIQIAFGTTLWLSSYIWCTTPHPDTDPHLVLNIKGTGSLEPCVSNCRPRSVSGL